MNEPSREEVEAALQAIAAATTDMTLREMQRLALEAAANVREGRERRVAYNGTSEEEYARVLMHEEETLKPGEELILRPTSGKEQEDGR